MKRLVRGEIKRFNTIGEAEAEAAREAIRFRPLSGYLGGIHKGGYYVEKLEAEWCDTFRVRYAVACNSATSGLLIACMAADIRNKRWVNTTPYTMSGTIAPAVLLGAQMFFQDIDPDTFCLDSSGNTTITTNLFGQPAPIPPGFVIEDNAQAIFAWEGHKYAGCRGDIGVFSLNVHKQIQAGEGGICVTNDLGLADRMRAARNHGEITGDVLGLNLRMTEVTAAIAWTQLLKASEIVKERIENAEILTAAVKDLPGLQAPVVREGCGHSYYVWALKCLGDRDAFVRGLQAEGVPVNAGYMNPLYTLPAFRRFASFCPVTEQVESQLIVYENCAWSPTAKQLRQFADAFYKVAEHEDKRARNQPEAATVSDR